MPELPDVELYVHKLRELVVGQSLLKLQTFGPFVLRTFDPSPKELEGKTISAISRLGKRIVFELEGDLFIVIHLMIAGRFQWKAEPPVGKPAGKIGLATFTFPNGALILTEAGSKKRAAIYIVRGSAAVDEHDPGGLEPLTVTLAEFKAALKRGNHGVKRVLTDPHVFSGIGNAYSDEILHAAKLSPLKQTKTLSDEEIATLHRATQETLVKWSDILVKQFAKKFPGPGDITAFRPDFAAHGKYGKSCPVCGKPIQRIPWGEHEANYCAACQTGGKLLADGSMSRLLKGDWPKTLEELE